MYEEKSIKSMSLATGWYLWIKENTDRTFGRARKGTNSLIVEDRGVSLVWQSCVTWTWKKCVMGVTEMSHVFCRRAPSSDRGMSWVWQRCVTEACGSFPIVQLTQLNLPNTCPMGGGRGGAFGEWLNIFNIYWISFEIEWHYHGQAGLNNSFVRGIIVMAKLSEG